MEPAGQDLSSSLIQIIPERHSVRNFQPVGVPVDLCQQIETFGNRAPAPFTHDVQFQVFQAEPGKRLYNNGVNPPDNLAVISPTDLISVSKAGFVGELVMLYAVSLGLSTCWFGHYKLSELGRYLPEFATAARLRESTLGYGYGNQTDVGRRVICCMPFGYQNTDSSRWIDRIAKRVGAGRKPLKELFRSESEYELCPAGLRNALESAKLAPSAGNSQMWRFGYDSETIILTVAMPVGYKHFKWEHPNADVGMCAAHLWLALLSGGYAPNVQIALLGGRAVWSFALRN